jgi:rhodanese-related sulfurtransferase
VNEIPTVSTQELQLGLDRDTGLHVLNVQTDRFFTGELIPGSRRIPLDHIERGTKHLSKDAEIVTYCGGPACSQSIQAAHMLRVLGFANVRADKEGLQG